MESEIPESRLIYVPNRLEGESTFEGKIYPHQRLNQYLDSDELQFMLDKLKKFIATKKEMKGYASDKGIAPELYGLYFRQLFFDLRCRIFIQIEENEKGGKSGVFIKPLKTSDYYLNNGLAQNIVYDLQTGLHIKQESIKLGRL